MGISLIWDCHGNIEDEWIAHGIIHGNNHWADTNGLSKLNGRSVDLI